MTVISPLAVNSDRLNRSITNLAEIGKLPNNGVRRLAYSQEDLQARQLVQGWMIKAGMTVRIDAAGNIIGTYPGQQQAPALATGSHIDTVPSGGRYDGVLGVLAGIEAVRVLHENRIALTHPVEVIVFADEEGTMIGAKGMSGSVVKDPEYYSRRDRASIQTCLQLIGGNWDKIATAKRTRSDIAAYVELHVEQGGVLESLGREIGVVEGIVSQHRYKITITGCPNHAGTTPMHQRQDALVAGAQVILAVNDLAKNTPGQQVATVGALNVFPNAANIVPGRVEMTVDIRDLSQTHVERIAAQLEERLKAIASATQTEIAIAPFLQTIPTLATPQIQQAIVQACLSLKLTHCTMPSRASHDAQEIGHFTDMGMIFVPSKAGISHAENEYTSPEQCTQGANVLLQTLLHLDQIYTARSRFPS